MQCVYVVESFTAANSFTAATSFITVVQFIIMRHTCVCCQSKKLGEVEQSKNSGEVMFAERIQTNWGEKSNHRGKLTKQMAGMKS